MTELEKMQANGLYNSGSAQDLFALRADCQAACRKLNDLPLSAEEERQALTAQLFGSVGKNAFLTPPFWCDYGAFIHAGDNFYTNFNCVILDAGGVSFGDNVFIAPNCGFYTSGHPIDAERRNAGLEYAWPITVGSDVWFGGGVQVMPGVTIGSDVVIGSGSVVTRDIPDHCVAAGNPCRVLRPITDEDRNASWDFSRRRK